MANGVLESLTLRISSLTTWLKLEDWSFIGLRGLQGLKGLLYGWGNTAERYKCRLIQLSACTHLRPQRLSFTNASNLCPEYGLFTKLTSKVSLCLLHQNPCHIPCPTANCVFQLILLVSTDLHSRNFDPRNEKPAKIKFHQWSSEYNWFRMTVENVNDIVHFIGN